MSAPLSQLDPAPFQVPGAASRPVVPTARRCGFCSRIRFRAGRRRFRSVFSRVYPHSDRRMPCVSGIIFRQRLQILKQGSPLRTARRNRTVRSNAMRSRCFFSLARRTLEVGIWSRIGMRMYARRANSTRFGTVCTHIATRNTEVLRALTCRTFSTDCRFGRQNKQSRKSFKFV